ncbi:MAG: glycosyltransferase [Candidatus Omnitrophica bacterium]|nr:glycosyltransferase [Candidatus Omnitrophota bacterium]
MKILLVGYHNPHFTNTMVWREKAVEYLGHELLTFDDRSFLFPGRLRDKSPFLHQWDLERLNKSLVQFVDKHSPDICLIVGGQRILSSSVIEIKKRGIWTALWTSDVPIDFKNILQAAPFYDHLFCAGSEAVDIFHKEGYRQVTWLPFACDQNFHKPFSLTGKEAKAYGRDLVFVGSYYPNRAKTLESLAAFDIGVWGPYWSKLSFDSKLKLKAVDVKMNFDQWVKIYSASKICVVIHYQDENCLCHQISPKVFEAMACGCFVLTDRQKDASKVFQDKEHLVFFDNESDLCQKAQYYLDNDEKRRQIARDAQAFVLASHRYQDRIKKILDTFQGKVGL